MRIVAYREDAFYRNIGRQQRVEPAAEISGVFYRHSCIEMSEYFFRMYAGVGTSRSGNCHIISHYSAQSFAYYLLYAKPLAFGLALAAPKTRAKV